MSQCTRSQSLAATHQAVIGLTQYRAGGREGKFRWQSDARSGVAAQSTELSDDTAQVKSPMTMTEKILAKHADRARVAPGENIWTNVDKLLTHDVCGPGTFGIFQKEFGENAQVG